MQNATHGLALYLGTARMASRKGQQLGSAVVELAIASTFLMLVLMGTMDFARLFYAGISVGNAAAAGAEYGAQSVSNSSNTDGIKQAALNDGTDITGLTASATRVCQCSGASVNCTTKTCPGGLGLGGTVKPVIYVQVTTTAPFKTLGNYPMIPSSVTVTKLAQMRAQ